MISPASAIKIGQAERIMDKFAKIGNKTSLDKLMGFVDGINDNTCKSLFYKFDEPFMLIELRDELAKKINLYKENIENINLFNYFGGYINGYLIFAPFARRVLDRFGKELPKYSDAMRLLEIPRFDENKNYFRTKDNIYNLLKDKNLLIYDDRFGKNND